MTSHHTTAALCALSYLIVSPTSMGASGPPDPAIGEPVEETTLVDLSDTIAPFIEFYNANADRPRFLAILSSTCGPCVSGAVAVNEAILRAFPSADVAVGIVWIDILPTDDLLAAQRASVIFQDKRVTQFHDADKLLANGVASGLIKRPPAWDIYLFYRTGVLWNDQTPSPHDWAHQLGGGAADETRFKRGVALSTMMHATMMKFGFKPVREPPTEELLGSARAAATQRISRRRATTSHNAPCKQCDATQQIGQCSLAGWSYVDARFVGGDRSPGSPVEISGAAKGPDDLAESTTSQTRLVYEFPALDCADCTMRLALKALGHPAVARVEVDSAVNRLIVHTVDNQGAKLETLTDQLRLAGFQVRPIDSP